MQIFMEQFVPFRLGIVQIGHISRFCRTLQLILIVYRPTMPPPVEKDIMGNSSCVLRFVQAMYLVDTITPQNFMFGGVTVVVQQVRHLYVKLQTKMKLC